MSKQTQHDLILDEMRAHPEKEWWYAPDFQRPGMERFVGYEASPRISELMRLDPSPVEAKREGKYRYIRLKK